MPISRIEDYNVKPKVLVDANKQLVHDDAVELLYKEADVIFEPIQAVKEEYRDAIALIALGVKVNEQFLQQVPNLKLVARFGVGYDNVDVAACTRHGVYATITQRALSEAVADHTFGLIIGVARHIVHANQYARTEWTTAPRGGFPLGVDLQNKTLGIVGLGRIGFQVAKRAHAFDMKLLYNDIVSRHEAESVFGMKPVPLEELLQESDFVTLHVSLNETTRGLIGKKELGLMKPTAYLINTARGSIVDQKALVEALRTGQIKAAGLDVFDPEPAPPDDSIFTLPNVLATPHSASGTIEARRRMGLSAVNEVLRIIRGERPLYVVPEQNGLVF